MPSGLPDFSGGPVQIDNRNEVPICRCHTNASNYVAKQVLVGNLQGFIIRSFPGFENVVPAVAYCFCLNLPATLLHLGMAL